MALEDRDFQINIWGSHVMICSFPSSPLSRMSYGRVVSNYITWRIPGDFYMTQLFRQLLGSWTSISCIFVLYYLRKFFVWRWKMAIRKIKLLSEPFPHDTRIATSRWELFPYIVLIGKWLIMAWYFPKWEFLWKIFKKASLRTLPNYVVEWISGGRMALA